MFNLFTLWDNRAHLQTHVLQAQCSCCYRVSKYTLRIYSTKPGRVQGVSGWHSVIWFTFRQFCEFWQFKDVDLILLMCLFKLEIFYYSLIQIFTFDTIKEANWFLFITKNFALQAFVFVHKLSKWARYHAVVFRQKKLRHAEYLLLYSFSIHHFSWKAASLCHTL